MRIPGSLTVLVLLGATAMIGAQSPKPPTGAPEVLSGTAQIKNGSGAISGTVEIQVRRYTPEFDRGVMEKALRVNGYPGFLTAIRNAPEVASVVLGGGQPYKVRYARERVEGSGRTIVLVTDQPIFFVGGGRTESKPRAGFEVAVFQIQMDGTGKGHGTMAGAARVRPDGAGGVRLDDYADEPIVLVNITRQPASPDASRTP